MGSVWDYLDGNTDEVAINRCKPTVAIAHSSTQLPLSEAMLPACLLCPSVRGGIPQSPLSFVS